MGPKAELREPMSNRWRRLHGTQWSATEPRHLQCANPQETQAIPERSLSLPDT